MPKSLNSIDKFKNLSDGDIELTISELAEMISLFYDEIKSIAKNLEEENYPLPQKDISDLHNSFLDYARMGNEFAERFKKRAESMEPPQSNISKDSELGTL